MDEKGKTTLIQKEPIKKKASNNYRPITCLPAEIREKIYDSQINCGLFPEE